MAIRTHMEAIAREVRPPAASSHQVPLPQQTVGLLSPPPSPPADEADGGSGAGGSGGEGGESAEGGSSKRIDAATISDHLDLAPDLTDDDAIYFGSRRVGLSHVAGSVELWRHDDW